MVLTKWAWRAFFWRAGHLGGKLFYLYLSEGSPFGRKGISSLSFGEQAIWEGKFLSFSFCSQAIWEEMYFIFNFIFW